MCLREVREIGLLNLNRVLKKGSKGEDVKALQIKLKEINYYISSIDGSFGPATDRAVRAFQSKNSLVDDGKVGPKTLETLNGMNKKSNNYYRKNNAYVLEVDPLDLYIDVVKKAGNRISGDFINGSLFGIYKNKMVSISSLVSNGKILTEQLPHDNVKRGTFIIYKDGTVSVEMIDFISKHSRLKDIKLAIGGFNILPGISLREQLKKEWFNYNTVGYRTWRSMIGYSKVKNKVLIVIAPNKDAEEGSKLLKSLGCNIGIGLDSGGSTCGRFNNKTIRTTTRVIHNIIRWT